MEAVLRALASADLLHGRSTGYVRHENAVKDLCALDQLASTVRHAKEP